MKDRETQNDIKNSYHWYFDIVKGSITYNKKAFYDMLCFIFLCCNVFLSN